MNFDSKPPHILVVNDSPDILALKDDILEDEGFRVSTRLREQAGLDEIAATNPDLLIIDYGSEPEAALLDELTTDPRTAQIPIVLCTGAIREVEADRPHLDALGIRVVYQPFDIDDLLAVVYEALGLPTPPGGSLQPPVD